MIRHRIKIGEVYLVRLGRGDKERDRVGKIVANYGNGWIVCLLMTGRRVYIRDWRRFRREAKTKEILSEVTR